MFITISSTVGVDSIVFNMMGVVEHRVDLVYSLDILIESLSDNYSLRSAAYIVHFTLIHQFMLLQHISASES